MPLFQKHIPAPAAQAGFSLIEVAIALAIIGILSVPYIQIYTVWKEDHARKLTYNNMAVIQSALNKFAARNGRYPVPANRSLAMGTLGDGQEYPLGSIAACTPANATVCRASAPWGPTGDKTVLIGAVPYAVLGLPQNYAVDGYQDKYTYAVTEFLTQTTSTTFNNQKGVVRLRDKMNSDAEGTSANLHYAVVSHGRDRKGAFNVSGLQPIPCGTSPVAKDDLNCDNDATFNNNFSREPLPTSSYSRKEASPAGVNHYDDYVYYTTTLENGLWAKRSGSGDIYSSLTGDANVLISPLPIATDAGGHLILPIARLDIRGTPSNPGNMKATQMNINRLCDLMDGCPSPTGSGFGPNDIKGKTFAPQSIGGTPNVTKPNRTGFGIYCGPNTAMRGIQYSDERCATSFPAKPAIGTCPSGTYPHAVVGGVLSCS